MFVQIEKGVYVDAESKRGAEYLAKVAKETIAAKKIKDAADKKEAIAVKTKALKEAEIALKAAQAL